MEIIKLSFSKQIQKAPFFRELATVLLMIDGARP